MTELEEKLKAAQTASQAFDLLQQKLSDLKLETFSVERLLVKRQKEVAQVWAEFNIFATTYKVG